MIKQAFSASRLQNILGLFVLVLFAITYGYFLENTLGNHQPLESYPDWRTAQWIKSGKMAGRGYFRKSFNLQSLPNRAYIVVSGTEDISVYLNEKIAGTLAYSGARPSTILDVTNLLRKGKNLLAVNVNSNVHGVSPELIARLVLVDDGNYRREIESDGTWRVARKQGFQKEGKLEWYSAAYNDLDWKTASIATDSSPLPALPLKVPEHVYMAFPRGYWLWSGNSEVTTLDNEFDVEGRKIHEAWLGVSTAGKYSILVNGVYVTSLQGTGRTMELVSISPYLQLGKNTISLQAENQSLQPRIMVSGMITTDIGLFELDSKANWLTLKNAGTSSTSMAEELDVLTNEMYQNVASQKLSLVYKEVELSGMLSLMKIAWVLTVSCVILSLLLVGFILFSRFARITSNHTIDEYFGLFVRPFVLGLIVVSVSILMHFDPRFVNYFLYQFYVITIVPILIVLFEVIILLEMRSKGESLDGN